MATIKDVAREAGVFRRFVFLYVQLCINEVVKKYAV